MASHYLKTINPYFQKVWERKKTFEVRKNDRNFKVGDRVVLDEYGEGRYLERYVEIKIDYILDKFEGLAEDYIAFSFTETDRSSRLMKTKILN